MATEFHYRQAVGTLMYHAIATVPDEAYAISGALKFVKHITKKFVLEKKNIFDNRRIPTYITKIFLLFELAIPFI